MTQTLNAFDLAICQRIAPIVAALGIDYDISMTRGAGRLMYESPEVLNAIMSGGGFQRKAECWAWLEQQRRIHARLMNHATRGIGGGWDALQNDIETMIARQHEEDGA